MLGEYFRPTDVEALLGDARKARNQLNWHPDYTFKQLISEMVNSDLELFRRTKFLKDNGYCSSEL